jgi:uncharacterized membrane protein
MSANRFDLKTILLAKHAQHVVLIHFPIALSTVGVLFDFLAQWTKHRLLGAAAYYNFFVAAIATIPVVFTGLVAWRWALWTVWLIHMKSQRNREVLPGCRLQIEVAAVAIVTVTGHLGGFLSGVNGPG